ncbi:MAG: ATP-dependent DNA helicase RecG [Myxococcales bacterium]|nr:ATP-dependent DNA helicase RecG [Myxococcales bacterium]
MRSRPFAGAKPRIGSSEALLDHGVECLQGIGRLSGAALRERGLNTVGDMLLLLPRCYVDERRTTPLTNLAPGIHQVTVGVVEQARRLFVRHRSMAEVVLGALPSDPSGPRARLMLRWYHAYPNQLNGFTPGSHVRASGRVSTGPGQLIMVHPSTEMLNLDTPESARIVTRYPDIASMGQKTLKKAVTDAVRRAAHQVISAVPASVSEREAIMPLADAICALHFPPEQLSDQEVEQLNHFCSVYHQRLAYEEFFLLELALHAQRKSRSPQEAMSLKAEKGVLHAARSAMPFKLSRAQERVIGDVSADMERQVPMRRLLQGDVGSGKTAVAMVAAAQAVRAGAQVAFMAPTEVLAEQHFSVLERFSAALGLRVRLVVGGVDASRRNQLAQELRDGVIDIAIGTHALIQGNYAFSKLGLVIVDEQHRFGVNQRLALVQKGDCSESSPHLLVITATPIPRSLALTLYGDLDVSVLDEMPPGRVRPITKLFGVDARDRALGILGKGLRSGGQAFVVCPSIEDSESLNVRSAERAFEELRGRLAPYEVGLLHGRLTYEQRQNVMAKFVEGQVQVLVSTTIIEVGVDVPRANVMLVEHAERFGLAQLHQLRGRIGRGGQVSACLLVHQATSSEALARLEVLARTSDGFEIAEEDLQQRGPGELLGRRQSGMPGFRFGNLKRDMDLWERARKEAQTVLAADPGLQAPAHRGAALALLRLKKASLTVVREEAG